jgi:Condensation domain
MILSDAELITDHHGGLGQIDAVIGGLSPIKRELLIQWLRRGLETTVFEGRSESGGASAFPPLSLAQQRLWFFDRMEPESAAYNIAGAAHLKGHLRHAALESGLREILRRHGALRTNFVEIERRAVQIVAPDVRFELPIVDLRHLDETRRRDELQNLLSTNARRHFNLERDQLLRAFLLQVGDSHNVLLLIIHHIVFDGWSMRVFVRELALLYEAYSKGEASTLPELSIQYEDYTHWQREWLKSGALEKQMAYWEERLRDAPPIMELRGANARPQVQSYRGEHELIVLPDELGEQLRELSRQEGVTLFMTLLAGFAILLRRYTGREDIILGTDTANRDRIEIEGLIGFFVNQLALRLDLKGDPAFREVQRRVKEEALGAYAHQEAPFHEVVGALRPNRDLSHAPLFQLKLVLRSGPGEEFGFPDLSLSFEEVGNGTAQCDLILNFMSAGGRLQGRVEYSADLFDRAMIRRMMNQYELILSAAVADPCLGVMKLSRLLEEDDERRREEQIGKTGQRLQRAKRRAVEGLS